MIIDQFPIPENPPFAHHSNSMGLTRLFRLKEGEKLSE